MANDKPDPKPIDSKSAAEPSGLRFFQSQDDALSQAVAFAVNTGRAGHAADAAVQKLSAAAGKALLKEMGDIDGGDADGVDA